MRFFLSLAVALLAALLVVSRVPAAQTAQLNRDILWAAVRVCVAAKRSVGLAAPCRSVNLGDERRPGTALLRVPGAASHYVFLPLDDYAGLEAPGLQGAQGAAVFNAAWAARAETATDRAPLARLGLAINSPLSRSQDHLHIHIDCVRSAVLSLVDKADIGDDWSWLPPSLVNRRYIARRVPADRIARFNPFAALVEFLPQKRLISQSSLAAIPDRDGGMIVLADVRPLSWAEGLLDHSCAR